MLWPFLLKLLELCCVSLSFCFVASEKKDIAEKATNNQ